MLKPFTGLFYGFLSFSDDIQLTFLYVEKKIIKTCFIGFLYALKTLSFMSYVSYMSYLSYMNYVTYTYIM